MSKTYSSKSNACRAFRAQFPKAAEGLTNPQLAEQGYVDEDTDGVWVVNDPAKLAEEDDFEMSAAELAKQAGRPVLDGKETFPTFQQMAEAPLPPAKPAPAKRTRAGVTIEKNREERNGVKRPSLGGVCREVWDFCDKVAKAGDAPTAKQVREEATRKNWNPNNAAIEFYQWRKFNGIVGRVGK